MHPEMQKSAGGVLPVVEVCSLKVREFDGFHHGRVMIYILMMRIWVRCALMWRVRCGRFRM